MKATDARESFVAETVKKNLAENKEPNPIQIIAFGLIGLIMLFASGFMILKGADYEMRIEDHITAKIVSTD